MHPTINKKNNYSVRCQLQYHINMSSVLFRLAGEKVYGASTPDGMVFSVYDFINVVCQNNGMYACQVWAHLNKDQFKFRLNANVVSTNVACQKRPKNRLQ